MSANLNITKIKVGQNADPAKNFLISTPQPEDGTLTIERENGTDVMKFLANGGVDMPSLPFLKSGNGYMTLPNGFIIQWGTTSLSTSAANTWAGGSNNQPLPVPFPTACVSAQVITDNIQSLSGQGVIFQATSNSLSALSIYAMTLTSGVAGISTRWIAIGY